MRERTGTGIAGAGYGSTDSTTTGAGGETAWGLC